MNFTQPFTLSAQTTGGTGPTATSTFVTADFTNPTGQSVSRYIYGVADGGNLGQQGFPGLSDNNLVPVLQSQAYTMYRLNSQCGYTERLFPSGGTTTTTAKLQAEFSNLINLFPTVCPNARLVMGIGFPPSNWSTSAAFASVCQQIASYLYTTNSTATGQPLGVYGFEIGNENNTDPGIPSYFTSYFNAGSTAIKGVNPNFQVFGPTFSYADSLNTFAASCAAHCDVLDYHAYECGGQSDLNGKASAVGTDPLAFALGANTSGSLMLKGLIDDHNSWVSGGGSASTPTMIGEYNINDTYGSLNGGQSPGTLNTYQQNAASAVFNANTLLSGLNSYSGFTMATIWSVWLDTDYGVIGGTDNINGGTGYTPCPGGYFLSQGGKVLYGARATVTTGSAAPGNEPYGSAQLTTLAVSGGPGVANFAVLLVNADELNAINGVKVALSHWPVNSTGNANVSFWQTSPANTIPAMSSLAVTAGVTANINLPAQSVSIIYA